MPRDTGVQAMRKDRRHLIRITVTGILFLLLLSGNALAAKKQILTASCPSVCAEKVTAYQGKNGMVLFLPGFWDLSRIVLEPEGTETLLIGRNATEINAGTETDLSGLAGMGQELRNGSGKSLGILTILQGSRIPSLFLEVDGEELGKVRKSKENVITEGRAVCRGPDGAAEYDGALEQLKGRGNNSFRYAKKPYQIKLSEKTPLCGMGRGKTWVLLANWTDVSLLRNQIVLDMSREIGLRNAVSCAQADLWINGEYQGLYLITEKIQIGKGRIDITNLEKEAERLFPSQDPGRLETEWSGTYPLLRSYPDAADPEDITGGYLLTIEKRARLRNNLLAGFMTKDDLCVRIKEPTCPSRAQAEYLFGLVSEMQRALIAEDGTEPQTGRTYREYLDESSFARKFLIEEWCKNYDFAGGSQYLYKDSDSVDPRIYAGPSWDYDLSFGNMADRGYGARGEYLTAYKRNYNLYWLLYSHESFRESVGDIWQQLFRPAADVLLGRTPADEEGILRSIGEYRDRIEASAKMNYRRWTVSKDATGKDAGISFDNAVRYLEKWIAERTEWMVSAYGPEAAGE